MGEFRDAPVDDASRVALLEARLAQAQEQFRATSDILAVLASASSEQDHVFDAVVDNARRLLRAQAAQIYLLEGDAYRLVRSSGISPEFLQFATRNPPRRDRASLVGRVTLDRTVRQIPDVLADPEYGRSDFQRIGGYRTIIGAPMLVGDQVVGALSVWRTEVDPFDEADEVLLSTFAEQAALALRHVQLFTALESRSAELGRKVDQLEALAEVGEAISSSLDPDEVLTTIVSRAVQLSGTDGGSLMEYDDATRTFRVRTAYGTSPDVLAALRETEIRIDETWVGRAARAREVHQITDLSSVPLDPHLRILFESGWRSLVAIPLARPDRVVGALVVRRKSTGSFSDETCEMLEAFASQSAVALTNARLYQQLERQSVELAEASRHKSEFLASMSHELRTPLNAVIGFSEVLLERMFGELNERQEDYLQDIHGAGRHLLALLGDILDLSKIEAGRMELDITSFPITEVLGHTLSLVRERATLHGIRLTLDADESLGMVEADELRLKQVLLNLLSNAVKFTPDGGAVDVRARREDGSLVITVSDTGIGIEPEDQHRIFDSFQQGGRSASSAEGTGLGLTLSKRIVELHGGRLWLTSTPAEGSTFGLSIPQPERRPSSHDELWMTEDTVPKGPVVVVIEDDPRSAELVSLHLEAAGLTAVVSRSGEEGLDAVRLLDPAAVILDIHLPGMDGWDVLLSLKSDAATAGVPVVVVSVEPERGRGFALGATEYLVKPVKGEHLLAAVERALPAWPTPTVDAPVSSLSAVIVDDDPLALKLVRSTLEPLGWTVHTCAGGQDAADVVRAVAPSVVIMDLLMPEVDGFAVIEQLRPDARTSGPPIVVLTAKALTPRDRERLEGRIAFVAQKAGLDLADLARRLAAVATDASRPGPEPTTGRSSHE